LETDQEDFRLENQEKIFHRNKAIQLENEIIKLRQAELDQSKKDDVELNTFLDQKFREIFEKRS
jgi:hypothetical protein